MTVCPICGKQNPDEAKFCQGCGTWLVDKGVTKPKAKSRWWLWVLVGVGAFFALIIVGAILGKPQPQKGPNEAIATPASIAPTLTPAPRPTLTPAPYTPGAAMLFPWVKVTLLEAGWKGSELTARWQVVNTAQKVFALSLLQVEATDAGGNTVPVYFIMWKRVGDKGEYTSQLWPTEAAEGETIFRFGPASKGVVVKVNATEPDTYKTWYGLLHAPER